MHLKTILLEMAILGNQTPKMNMVLPTTACLILVEDSIREQIITVYFRMYLGQLFTGNCCKKIKTFLSIFIAIYTT